MRHFAAVIGLFSVLGFLGGCGSAGSAPVPPPPPAQRDRASPPSVYVDAVFSFLPNVGLGVGGGHLLSDTPRRSWSLELGATYQFLDDEDFAADGNPKAGPWYQVRAGLKTSAPYAPEEGRHLTGRLGAVWLQANGEPNILQRAGNHVGLYGGIGFETHLTSSLSVGPEVTFLFVSRQDELSLARPIPQLNWHAIWWPGRTYSGSPSQLGEVYGGVTAVSSPWLGGGFEAGQVFTKSALATCRGNC